MRLSVPRVAYALLLLLGLAALVGSGISVANYVSSVRSVRNLELEITDLQFIDDDNPRVIIHFRLHNHSPLAITVKAYFFELTLNEARVGGSNSAYRGTDIKVDPAVYSQAANINQVLAPQQQLDLDFTLFIFTAQQDIIRREQTSAAKRWTANAGFRLIFPNASAEKLVRLRAIFAE